MAKAEKQSDLSNLEKIVLLGLDDKGWFGNSENNIKFGIAGAIIYELFIAGRIEIKDGKIVVVNPDPVQNPIVNKVFTLIAKAKKQRSITTWIQKLAYRKLMLRKYLIKQLVNKEVIRKEEYSLMWIFYQNKFPLINDELKRKVQQDLFDDILTEKKIPSESLMLIAVMSACKMIKKNLRGTDNSSLIHKRINELMKFPEPLSKKTMLIRDIKQGISRAIIASNVSIHA